MIRKTSVALATLLLSGQVYASSPVVENFKAEVEFKNGNVLQIDHGVITFASVKGSLLDINGVMSFQAGQDVYGNIPSEDLTFTIGMSKVEFESLAKKLGDTKKIVVTDESANTNAQAELEVLLKAEEDAKAKAAELKAEEDAKAKAAELKAEEDAKAKAAELKAEEDAKAKAAELKAEEDAKAKAAELKAEEDAKTKAAELKAEEDAKTKAAELKAEEDVAVADAQVVADANATATAIVKKSRMVFGRKY